MDADNKLTATHGCSLPAVAEALSTSDDSTLFGVGKFLSSFDETDKAGMEKPSAGLHSLAEKSTLTDLILVLPSQAAEAFVRQLTNESNVGFVGTAACVFHVIVGCGSACLSAKAELPFRFNGTQDWFSANINNWVRYVASCQPLQLGAVVFSSFTPFLLSWT
jgi:hypothetical protein